MLDSCRKAVEHGSTLQRSRACDIPYDNDNRVLVYRLTLP